MCENLLNDQQLGRRLFDFAQIWYRVCLFDTLSTSNVHNQGIKGQGHSVT